MPDEKPSRVDAWFAKNKEKALAALEPHVGPGDELLHFAAGWQYPLDVLTWLPFIGSIFEMRKKRYLLGVTKEKLIIMRVGKFRFEEVNAEAVPMSQIQGAAVRKFPLFCNLVISLPGGKKQVFKEMPYGDAAGLKDAIDQVQGKPSTIG